MLPVSSALRTRSSSADIPRMAGDLVVGFAKLFLFGNAVPVSPIKAATLDNLFGRRPIAPSGQTLRTRPKQGPSRPGSRFGAVIWRCKRHGVGILIIAGILPKTSVFGRAGYD